MVQATPADISLTKGQKTKGANARQEKVKTRAVPRKAFMNLIHSDLGNEQVEVFKNLILSEGVPQAAAGNSEESKNSSQPSMQFVKQLMKGFSGAKGDKGAHGPKGGLGDFGARGKRAASGAGNGHVIYGARGGQQTVVTRVVQQTVVNRVGQAASVAIGGQGANVSRVQEVRPQQTLSDEEALALFQNKLGEWREWAKAKPDRF